MMRRANWMISGVIAVFGLSASVAHAQLINEFQPNPDGGDPAMVSIELRGTPSTAFSGNLFSIEAEVR